MLHHIFRTLSNGKSYEAPIPEDVHRVLDIGCVSVWILPSKNAETDLFLKGTGLWAIEFGKQGNISRRLGN
jgi:hypothetical protein